MLLSCLWATAGEKNNREHSRMKVNGATPVQSKHFFHLKGYINAKGEKYHLHLRKEVEFS